MSSLVSTHMRSMPRSSDPLTVLVIGPSQNGKTTFINRIIQLAVNEVPFGKEGDGNFKCTTKCGIYDLAIPLTDYFLRDKATGKEYDVPDITDEEEILKDAWWRKQTALKYGIEPCRPNAPTVSIRLIDTPGLDDSEGKDFENMSDVLETLNQLAKSPMRWERRIHAVVLVYNSQSPFSYSFQSIIKDYHRCMPNLFGGLSVVNTNFSIAHLASKRQHLVRDKLLGSGESARAKVLRTRTEDFRKIVGDGLSPTHFFIDNKPKARLAYDELLSRNAIFDIVSFWATAKPMPISQMRLIKTPTMQAIDKRIQSYLQTASEAWTVELKSARRNASDRDAFRSTLKQRKEELENRIARLQADLDLIDNDTEFAIQTHTTQDDPGVIELFGRWIVRSRVRNTMHIKEDSYPEFDVRADDSTRASWVSKSFNPTTRTWSGEYEGDPGRAPNLVARSFTTNRVKHRQRIVELRVLLRRERASLAENQSQWDQRMESADSDSSENSMMDKLVMQIEAANDLSGILEQPRPPVDKAYGEASRKRYKKSPRDIGHQDLYDLVGEAKPELLKPLQRVLL
jgi:GTPase SAR1 family protein